MNKIIEFSIRNKLIIILAVLGLIGYGSYQVSRLPIDAVPDITNNQVQIITVSPALGAPDVERLITFPIEQACSNIPGLREIRSFSRFGLALVTVVFDDDVDVYWARQQVTERLQTVQAELPRGIGTPSLAPVTTGLGEIYQYVVRAREGYEGKYDAMQLRTIQDWIVRRQLLGVEGVADVSSFGGHLKQYQVSVNPSKLAASNTTISDICNALERNNSNTGGTYIEKGPTVLFIRSEGLAGSIADIEQMVVRQLPNGTPLLIKDVADVHLGPAVRYGAMCYNDQGEVAGAVVMMLKGENSGRVIKKIKERVTQIQKTLPEGVVIEPFLDRTKMVNNAIHTVERNLLEGSLIVVFILILFLGNVRSGLIVASVIPLSMLFAIIMMNIFGVSGNLMSLGALDFGLIVDGAVIIVEAVLHRLSHSATFRNVTRLSQTEMDEEVNHSASRMMNSAVFGQVIILIVYLPIFTLQGIEGKMFRPMAQTVVFALLGAFLLSLTYIPMMSALFISKRVRHKPTWSDRMMEKLSVPVQRVLEKALSYPKTMVAVALALFIPAVWVLASRGGEFIPQLEEGDFAVDTRVLTGSNLNTTIEATQKVVSLLIDRFPEIEKVVTKIGSGEIPTDPMPVEASDMMVILKDKKEWTSAKSFPELAEKMSLAAHEVPGITTGFQFPVQMRFNELMTGARQDVVCKIFGDDLDTLARYAGELGKLATAVEGARDIYIETVTGMPQIVIRYDRALIAQYGLDIEQVNNVVNAAFGGQRTGVMYEGERRFDVVVRLAQPQRQTVEDVSNLLIPAAGGSQVPLGHLATVAIKEGPNQIQREDAKRRIVVGFNVRGRDVQTIVQELQKEAGRLQLPPGYYITYGGAFENLTEARKRLSIVVPVALGLIFIMLYFAFRSVKHSLIIYSAIPLSAIGGSFALAARGMPFSISAGIGFIALFGVSVLNGIVLIAEFRKLKEQGLTDLREIVLRGTRTRLRPVLMTASVASLGFLPMAMSNGAGAEVQRPLATVVIGGLLTATMLTLFLLPVLYSLAERSSLKQKGSAAAILMLLFLIPASGRAQNTITLKAAIDSALENNVQLRSQRLAEAYHGEMKATAWDIGKTSITTEWGHVNSAYRDTRFGVSQSIPFPTVFAKQKDLLENRWTAARQGRAIRERELAREVALLYNSINNLYLKKTALTLADSLYGAFERKAQLRFDLGESNTLEKVTAENQNSLVQVQLALVMNDLQALQRQFDYLVNTKERFRPEENALQLEITLPQDEALREHPLISLLQTRLLIAEDEYQLERHRLLPDISLGYFNQSFSGWQKTDGAERLYTASERFSSVQAGLEIPLVFPAKTARVRAASINKKIASAEQEDGKQMLQTQFDNAVSRYVSRLGTVRRYQQRLNPNAEQMIGSADLQYTLGDISYLEYVMLLNQALEIRNSYYEALKLLNESVIEINYLIKHE